MNQNKYQLGLVSVSFRKYSPEEIIKAARHAGLSCIEWGSDVHAPCHDTERLKEIACLQEASGMSCCSYGTYFRLGQTPVEELYAYIAAAKRLGTHTLRLWCGVKSGKDMTEQERAWLMQQCREAINIAAQHGVVLCMECHGHTFTECPEDAVALMQAMDSPHFRMYWQPFQWVDASKNLAMARAVSPYAAHIHVFHWKGEERFPLREAMEEWRTYLAAFSTPRTLLLEFMPDDRIETLPVEADALRAIVEEGI